MEADIERLKAELAQLREEMKLSHRELKLEVMERIRSEPRLGVYPIGNMGHGA
jgi:hypothetical protein